MKKGVYENENSKGNSIDVISPWFIWVIHDDWVHFMDILTLVSANGGSTRASILYISRKKQSPL